MVLTISAVVLAIYLALALCLQAFSVPHVLRPRPMILAGTQQGAPFTPNGTEASAQPLQHSYFQQAEGAGAGFCSYS